MFFRGVYFSKSQAQPILNPIGQRHPDTSPVI
jgi:hypothetical protein